VRIPMNRRLKPPRAEVYSPNTVYALASSSCISNMAATTIRSQAYPQPLRDAVLPSALPGISPGRGGHHEISATSSRGAR